MQIYTNINVLTGAQTWSSFYESYVNDQTVVQPLTSVRMPREPCLVTVPPRQGWPAAEQYAVNLAYLRTK